VLDPCAGSINMYLNNIDLVVKKHTTRENIYTGKTNGVCPL
jgi:hypothetical protein